MEIVINKEKINRGINKLKKNIFSIYDGQTTYYNKGLGICPSGYDFYTLIILFGIRFKIIKRTCRF